MAPPRKLTLVVHDVEKAGQQIQSLTSAQLSYVKAAACLLHFWKGLFGKHFN